VAVVRQRQTLRRLFDYATPYRVRMAWAILGMIVYAIGSAGLAYLIKPIFDSVLPKQQEVAFIAWMIVAVYLLKGIGSYASSYLMADVGQRVVMDLRNALYRHILDQSAGFFAQPGACCRGSTTTSGRYSRRCRKQPATSRANRSPWSATRRCCSTTTRG
jgi:ABC-type multidrug transport system fused ATPase/permease subunit